VTAAHLGLEIPCKRMESLENQLWVLVDILKSVLLKIKERLFVSLDFLHTLTLAIFIQLTFSSSFCFANFKFCSPDMLF